MGKFLESEKTTQIQFKNNSPYFSAPARLEGIYSGKPRPFCVPSEFAEQNLFQKFENPHFRTFPNMVLNGIAGKTETK